jgi:hypothetical protein
MVEYPDGDVQCVLCGRLVAEWQAGELQLNQTYPGDAREALRTSRCVVCGGRLLVSGQRAAGAPAAGWRPAPE